MGMTNFELKKGKTSFIAEIGPNHDGNLNIALELVRKVAAAGADAVKFQTYSAAGTVVSQNAPLADYMKTAGDWSDQGLLLESVRLTQSDFVKISRVCEEECIAFLSTPFDCPSVDFLLELGMSAIKVPSGEITNPFLIRCVAKTGLPLIVSTGMATCDDINWCLNEIRSVWAKADLKLGEDPITLLHCTSAYPTAAQDTNLLAMDLLREEFDVPIGFSDHTIGMVAPLAAAAKGAVVVEKHISYDPKASGPDHAASLSVDDLPDLISSIREIETVLGSKQKKPVNQEKNVALVARRSLVAAREIKAGEIYSWENLSALRPQTGVPAQMASELIGRRAARFYQRDEMIDVCETEA